MSSYYLILFVSFLSSGVGFLAQNLISGYWSTTFSDDILTFSLGISFFFLGMALSSLWSRMVEQSLKFLFVFALGSAFYLGVVIPLIKGGITLGISHVLFCVILNFVAGMLSGFSVPLALKALEGKTELGTLFFLDYLAAIFFSFLFTFVLLVPYGYQKTSFFVSLGVYLCILLLGLLLKVFSRFELAGLFALVGIILFIHTVPQAENKTVIFQKQTHYQKIVLTEIPDPLFAGNKTHHLYLDGFLQFSGENEQNYHACLVNIPMSAVNYGNSRSASVLVLGGGDGLAVRNVLQNPAVQKIDLVELDPEMLRLAKEHPIFLKYNNRALLNPKVQLVEQDAFSWVGSSKEKYDLIIIDFPAPKNLTLARLFSLEFYKKVKLLLKETGFISIQAGPSYSFSDENGETLSEVTSSIIQTLLKIDLHASAYVASSDAEAFVLAWKNSSFDMDAFSESLGMYNESGVGSLCTYRKTWKQPQGIEVNTLNTLPISRYMLDWFKQRQGSFFVYRGAHSVFLPE